MKKYLVLLLSSFAIAASAPALAGASDVEAVLERQRQHGFSSPSVAIKQLTDVSAGIEATPQDLQMRYHAALIALYIYAEQHDGYQRELAILQRMADKQQCEPCRYHVTIRQIHHATRGQDNKKVKELLPRLETLNSPDPLIQQHIHYTRAAAHGSLGNQPRALDEALKAGALAGKNQQPAEQVRILNLMMLANIGRRDLGRAEALADEAYALAARIGYTYMMAYIRGNQGWIYALKGEPQKQLKVLNEALHITRTHPGLDDAQLVNLVNLAEYHYTAKSYPQAMDLARQAVALADKHNKITAKGVVLTTLAQSQVALGEHDKGIATMQQSVDLLKKAGAQSYLIDATEAQAAVYENTGRHREALVALREFNKLKNEATQKEREKALAEAQEKFSAERKDNEIVRLSLENAKREAEVQARAWQQRLWAMAAVALALGGALLIQMIARARRRNRALEDSNAVLSDQSMHDPMTGAFNRRHCMALMAQQEAILASRPRARLSAAGVGLMLIDVDHFKHVNDTYGHAAGDAVLIEIARRLQDLVRQNDVVVRWGGEEFVLVLQRTAPDGMAVLAERALRVIAQAPVASGPHLIPVTISAGCVTYPMFTGQPWQECLKVADLAMYTAKEEGRNRAVCIMSVREGATDADLGIGLATARDAGDIVLHTIRGPAQKVSESEAMAI